MNYDKNSFLAGLAAGIQLKGWAGGGGLGGSGALSDIIVRSQPTTFVETPAEGFYGIGSVTVQGDENLAPQNIKYGVSILGIAGSYAPADPKYYAAEYSVSYNGVYNLSPKTGYDGIRSLKLTVDVPTEIISQSKGVTPGRSSRTVYPDEGYNTLSSVTVSGDDDLVSGNIRSGVTIFGVTGTYGNVLQSKSATPKSYSFYVRPDEGYDALSSVYVIGDADLVPANIREGVTIFGVAGTYSTGQVYQTKTVTPSRYAFDVIADAGYDALARVRVNTDANLTPGNIAKGVTIFGVTGTYISPMKPITVIPSEDEQYITPADGFYGFSSVTVAPAEKTGDYSQGYADGAASRDDEITQLQEQIAALKQERDKAYQSGYEAGYAEGSEAAIASIPNGDEVSY